MHINYLYPDDALGDAVFHFTILRGGGGGRGVKGLWAGQSYYREGFLLAKTLLYFNSHVIIQLTYQKQYIGSTIFDKKASWVE